MRLKLLQLWRSLHSSYWFVPALMVSGAVALAFTNLYLDRHGSGAQGETPAWLATAGAEAARSLLSTIAASMITVAGVSFSVVIVALTLASSQFGPRLLEGFMRDRGNQLVLGTFVSIFVYCLVVLLHLPGEAGSRMLPQTSVLTGVSMAVVGLGVLIYFYHHISVSIQAGHLVLEAGRSLQQTIAEMLPAEPAGERSPWPPAGFSEANATVPAPHSGYLSRLSLGVLIDVARRGGLRLMLVARPGDFLVAGHPLVLATPPEKLNPDLESAIVGGCALTRRRGQADDLFLAVDRLTEIAVRALSPGINDPNTVLIAMDQLTARLDVALSRLPAPSRFTDDDGEPRVYVRPPSAEELLERSFGPIRTYGSNDPRIVRGLLSCLRTLGRHRSDRLCALLVREAERAVALAGLAIELDGERAGIEEDLDGIHRSFGLRREP